MNAPSRCESLSAKGPTTPAYIATSTNLHGNRINSVDLAAISVRTAAAA